VTLHEQVRCRGTLQNIQHAVDTFYSQPYSVGGSSNVVLYTKDTCRMEVITFLASCRVSCLPALSCVDTRSVSRLTCCRINDFSIDCSSLSASRDSTCQLQCQCQSKISNVARIAGLLRSPRKRSRVTKLYVRKRLTKKECHNAVMFLQALPPPPLAR